MDEIGSREMGLPRGASSGRPAPAASPVRGASQLTTFKSSFLLADFDCRKCMVPALRHPSDKPQAASHIINDNQASSLKLPASS